MNIEIYTKDFCIWCDRAKSLLESKNLSFTEIDLSDDSVPQIFMDNKRIGGFQELVRWFGDGN